MKTHAWFSIAFLFLGGWAATVLVSFWVPWILLPDLLMVMMIYLYYYAPQSPLWRCLLPISLLMDLSVQVPFGFHGLLYVLVAGLAFPLRQYWRVCSFVEQMLAVLLMAVFYPLIRFLLIYLLFGISAPAGWYWTIVGQILLWPVLRALMQRFAARHLLRGLS